MTDDDLRELTELWSRQAVKQVGTVPAILMTTDYSERTDRACQAAHELVEELRVVVCSAKTRREMTQLARALLTVSAKIDTLARVALTLDERWEDLQ